jgi:hypothetical protein
MSVIENPALKAFVSQMGNEMTLPQVLIRRRQACYELRHIDDRDELENSLRRLALTDLRQWVQYDAAGGFRPLKSTPDLKRGWRLTLADDEELETALNHLYPGALADWFAAQLPNPPVTNYREYTGRQSGMYRITTMLTDVQVAEVIGAVCDIKHCLKRRLWTVAGTPADEASAKSLVPCLEPCALLMEAARKALRASQKEESSDT